MKYDVEMVSGGMIYVCIYIPNSMTIGSDSLQFERQ